MSGRGGRRRERGRRGVRERGEEAGDGEERCQGEGGGGGRGGGGAWRGLHIHSALLLHWSCTPLPPVAYRPLSMFAQTGMKCHVRCITVKGESAEITPTICGMNS